MCVCVHVRVCMYECVCMCECVYVSTNKHTLVFMCVCVCVYKPFWVPVPATTGIKAHTSMRMAKKQLKGRTTVTSSNLNISSLSSVLEQQRQVYVRGQGSS